MKMIYPRIQLFFLAFISLTLPYAYGADSTWATAGGGDWSNSGNWSNGVPGSTSSTDNADIATFGTSITNTAVIDIDSSRNIGGITFNYDFLGATNGYSLKNNIMLSAGGVIQEISTVTPTATRVSRLQNDVHIQGDGSSATIRNNATSSNVRMFLNGVRGNSTAGNTTTLYLDGTNTAPNTFGSKFTDGDNGGKLAVVKNGAGYWRLTSADSDYSGGTTLNAGRLQYNAGNTALSTVFGTGTLYLNGGVLQNTESIGGIPLITEIANEIVVGGNFQFSTKAASYNTTNFSGNMDLTGATRQINVDGAANSAVILSGVISNGGITKTGNETLILKGVNTYVGDTTVSKGTLILEKDAGLKFVIGANGVNNQITGTANITLNGNFTFDLTGADTTNGNSWNIVDVSSLIETYDVDFSVNGFTNHSGIWTMVNDSTQWTFTQSTGVLDVGVIPEPQTAALILIGMGAFLCRQLRRKNH